MTNQIGKYQLEKTIGEGTFGKVQLGKHTTLGHSVAIKLLEKKKIQESADLERVKRELSILQKLHHPHVVQLYEIIESEDYIYLIMEYASGGELFDHIADRGRIKEPETCKFMHQLISGIEYIHSLNIAHRDLKPENILLTSLQNLLIVDFGLSNTYQPGEKLKTACGSPCYAAPEMVSGRAYNGLKTDLWSCGVIMYALICGYLPFEDQNTQVLYKKILTADFHIPRFVSVDAKSLLKSILCSDPDERFGIEEIRQHKWWQLYDGPEVKMDVYKQHYKSAHLNFLSDRYVDLESNLYIFYDLLIEKDKEKETENQEQDKKQEQEKQKDDEIKQNINNVNENEKENDKQDRNLNEKENESGKDKDKENKIQNDQTKEEDSLQNKIEVDQKIQKEENIIQEVVNRETVKEEVLKNEIQSSKDQERKEEHVKEKEKEKESNKQEENNKQEVNNKLEQNKKEEENKKENQNGKEKEKEKYEQKDNQSKNINADSNEKEKEKKLEKNENFHENGKENDNGDKTDKEIEIGEKNKKLNEQILKDDNQKDQIKIQKVEQEEKQKVYSEIKQMKEEEVGESNQNGYVKNDQLQETKEIKIEEQLLDNLNEPKKGSQTVNIPKQQDNQGINQTSSKDQLNKCDTKTQQQENIEKKSMNQDKNSQTQLEKKELDEDKTEEQQKQNEYFSTKVKVQQVTPSQKQLQTKKSAMKESIKPPMPKKKQEEQKPKINEKQRTVQSIGSKLPETRPKTAITSSIKKDELEKKKPTQQTLKTDSQSKLNQSTISKTSTKISDQSRQSTRQQVNRPKAQTQYQNVNARTQQEKKQVVPNRQSEKVKKKETIADILGEFQQSLGSRQLQQNSGSQHPF